MMILIDNYDSFTYQDGNNDEKTVVSVDIHRASTLWGSVNIMSGHLLHVVSSSWRAIGMLFPANEFDDGQQRANPFLCADQDTRASWGKDSGSPARARLISRHCLWTFVNIVRATR
jgi:hypothetical protein